MSKYEEVKNNPIKNNISGMPSQVVFYLVSAMCDNKSKITFIKKENGEYKIDTDSQHINNFGFKFDFLVNAAWAADEGNWSRVFYYINQGYSKIYEVKCKKDKSLEEAKKENFLSRYQDLESEMFASIEEKLKSQESITFGDIEINTTCSQPIESIQLRQGRVAAISEDGLEYSLYTLPFEHLALIADM